MNTLHLPEDERRQRRRRARMEAFGPVRFVLLFGALGWGTTTALLFAWVRSRGSDRGFLEQLPLALLVFPLVGILQGALTWAWLRACWARQDRAGRLRAGLPQDVGDGPGEGPQ